VRRTLPFALHQVIELVLGVALVALSVHVSHPQLLVATGIAFVLLALLSDGRLGAVHLIPARVHAWLDVMVALAAAVAPVFPRLRPDLTGIVCIELAALAWLRIATLTRYRAPAPRLTASSPPGEPDPSGRPDGADPSSRVSTELDRVVRTGSHRLGRLAGAAARTYALRNQRAVDHAGHRSGPPGGGDPGRPTDAPGTEP
jgi:hypothetical protein